MAKRKISNRLARMSVYSHAEDHLTYKTFYGGLITIFFGILAIWLIVTESVRCLSFVVLEDTSVDSSREETMHVRFNITFPALPCRTLRVTMGDSSGNFETESVMKHVHDGEVHKWRLDASGRHVERQEFISPRGSDNPYQIMLDYDDLKAMREEIISHSGCNVNGWMDVKRVSGNLAILVRQEAILAAEDDIDTMEALIARHMQHMNGMPGTDHGGLLLNASHAIHVFRFGGAYPGQLRPLENTAQIDRKATGLDKYFIKVVPVTRISYWGRQLHSHDYSVTEYYEPILAGKSTTLPGVLFMYDLWPLRITKTVSRLGLLHLLVRLSAVVGGLWTVAGITNRTIHSCTRHVMKIFFPSVGRKQSLM